MTEFYRQCSKLRKTIFRHQIISSAFRKKLCLKWGKSSQRGCSRFVSDLLVCVCVRVLHKFASWWFCSCSLDPKKCFINVNIFKCYPSVTSLSLTLEPSRRNTQQQLFSTKILKLKWNDKSNNARRGFLYFLLSNRFISLIFFHSTYIFRLPVN